MYLSKQYKWIAVAFFKNVENFFEVELQGPVSLRLKMS